jgi:alanine racemase
MSNREMSLQRPVVAEIDLSAVAENTRAIRDLIGSDIRFYGVVKGDAYGIGLLETARIILESGADAIATSAPDDVIRMRRSGIDAPILLYPSTTPAMASKVAELGVIVTLHDLSSVQAFAAQTAPLEAHIKLDCGFGRLGLAEAEWAQAFEAVRRAYHIRLVGLYTHLGHTEDAASVHRQMEVFQRAVAAAEACGFSNLERMVASTRVTIGYPEYHLDAINPGIGIYGLLEDPWLDQFQPRSVLRRLFTEVLQVKSLPAGSTPGYLDERPLAREMTIAILAAGFANGLPRIANGMPVLIRGQRATTVGMRSTEHTVVDVTNIPDVRPGDEAVIIGSQGEAKIDPAEFSEKSELPLIEIFARLTRAASRSYFSPGAPKETISRPRKVDK